jgi:hypothetical protein
VDVP